MKHPFLQYAFLCMAGVLVGESCSKAKPPKPIINIAAQSPDCIDTLLGVYYGTSSHFYETRLDGQVEDLDTSSGPDIAYVTRSGQHQITVQFSRVGVSNTFVFDTTVSPVTYQSTSSSAPAQFTFQPYQHRISYHFYYGYNQTDFGHNHIMNTTSHFEGSKP